MTSTQVQPPPVAPPPQRRQRRFFKIAIATILGVAVLGIGAAIAFVLWTESKIERIPDEQVQSLTPLAEDEPRNILVVGTDDRSQLPDDFEHFGDPSKFTGSRTDVIMLVHFVPGEGAQLLSLPRDLKVTIPGEGVNKINSAYVFGGADLLITTIQENLDVTINNYLEIDFGGFARLVDALGGVSLEFEHAARDAKSGLDVEAGRQTLDGEQALAFVRSRKYQKFEDGQWSNDDASDLGRTRRQQRMLLAVFDQVTSPSSAFELPSFATTFADVVKADPGLGIGAIVSLGRQALDLRSGDLSAITLPVFIDEIDGISFVIPLPEAQDVIDAFNSGSPFPRP